MCERKFYPDWSAKDWGLVTNQDYTNVGQVHAGMKSRGCKGLRFNPRQEANVLHMHQVIDRYLRSSYRSGTVQLCLRRGRPSEGGLRRRAGPW